MSRASTERSGARGLGARSPWITRTIPTAAPLAPVRNLSVWAADRAPAAFLLALGLFLAVSVLRVADPVSGDSEGILYVLPIAVLSLGYGLRGGLVGGCLGIALITIWDAPGQDAVVTLQSNIDRGVAFMLLGAALGGLVDGRRRLEAQVLDYFNESVDLLATANLTGTFTRVNPAWERVLGHTPEMMCSRPYADFVHPDDRQRTIDETACLLDGSHKTVGFRNRYRAADGSYVRLDWSAVHSSSENVIHATARDATAQHEAETEIAERTSELEVARKETLQRLALAAEYRDDETFQHTERVGLAATAIGMRLGLPEAEVALLSEAAPLHDVGKLAIPDGILLKAGALSEHEREVIETHAALGARLLAGSSSPVLQMAMIIALSHHERWDGSGYPGGLAGTAIPLVGRVVAVIDVFDALTHDRPYKPAWSFEDAIAEIERGAGSQFDPRIVAAFLATHNRLAARPPIAAVPPPSALGRGT